MNLIAGGEEAEAGVGKPGSVARGELSRFRCATCAHGARAAKPPPRCPMCGGSYWEDEGWRPFTRLAADLLPRRHRVARARLADPRARSVENALPARFAFRQLNEEIRRLEDRWATKPLDVICECDEPYCFAALAINVVDYDRLRADPDQFLVLPGHEPPSAGKVAESGPGYVIVRYEQKSLRAAVAPTVEETTAR